MQRVVTPELLDTDAGTPPEVDGSMSELRTINRYLRGSRTMIALSEEVARRRQLKKLSWLDVGGATGELVALTSKSVSKRGLELQAVVLDRSPSHMDGRYPSVGGDALALPFKESSFDVAGSSLLVHHLEPPDVIKFVNEALRVVRHAVLINDLIRHPLHVALAYAGYAVYRSRLTRHDAVGSVRCAYTVNEIEKMLQQTQAAKVEIKTFFPFRMGVIAWKRPNMT